VVKKTLRGIYGWYESTKKRSLYVSFDVTKDLQEGENVIGVLLGNGWYNHQNLKNDPGEMNNQIPGESRR
jgi:hypothetical protein